MIKPPRPFLIGMIHLPPLPGSARHAQAIDDIVASALADARAIAAAGFDGLMIENYGDAPFSAGRVEASSVAAMAVVADQVRRAVTLPTGINALRNDGRSALAIAAASKAAFVRVNVLSGVYATDQGFITGEAAAVMRERAALGCDVAVYADVHVKHAVPVNQPDIAEAARETAYRGLADGLIVSGVSTGAPVDLEILRRVRQAVPDRLLLVGSGATEDTIGRLLQTCDGAIVGTHIKCQSQTTAPVDPRRAEAFVKAARR